MAPPNTDLAHLAKLQAYYARHRILPTSYASIGKVVGFRTKNAAVKLLERLRGTGYLSRNPDGKFVPTDRFLGLTVMESTVRAGRAEPVPESGVQDVLTLNQLVTGELSATMVLPVRGDSMTDAGILDGDLAIVERTTNVRSGQFVVARIDGEFTLKELCLDKGEPVLRAHNANYPPLRPSISLEIVGVVRGIVRSYGDRDRPVRKKVSRKSTDDHG